jgi:hypothetical protein
MWSPVLVYRTKWLNEWTREWFYIKVDTKIKEELQDIFMSPLRVRFDYKKPLCNKALGLASQAAHVAFVIVVHHIGTQDLAQEFLADQTFPTLFGWRMLKPRNGDEETENGVLKVLP